MDITFDNRPNFEHIEHAQRREVALRQHRDFESELERQDEGVLYEAVASLAPPPLRAQEVETAFVHVHVCGFCTKPVHPLALETWVVGCVRAERVQSERTHRFRPAGAKNDRPLVLVLVETVTRRGLLCTHCEFSQCEKVTHCSEQHPSRNS